MGRLRGRPGASQITTSGVPGGNIDRPWSQPRVSLIATPGGPGGHIGRPRSFAPSAQMAPPVPLAATRSRPELLFYAQLGRESSPLFHDLHVDCPGILRKGARQTQGRKKAESRRINSLILALVRLRLGVCLAPLRQTPSSSGRLGPEDALEQTVNSGPGKLWKRALGIGVAQTSPGHRA